ncbi:hypothetical protein GCM10027578_32040 [Spirosoma luteolum]
MLTYLTVHNNGITTTFQPTSTLSAARAHLVDLLDTGAAKANDVLSIVEMPNDRVVYYNATHNSYDSIYAVKKKRTNFLQDLISTIQHVVGQTQYTVR